MKDRIEIAIVLRTDEVSGKGAKAIATALKSLVAKVEPQLVRIAEAFTKYAEKELETKE